MGAVEVLRQLTESAGLELLEFNIKSLEFAEAREEMERIEKTLGYYDCLKCPQFNEHVSTCTVHVLNVSYKETDWLIIAT